MSRRFDLAILAAWTVLVWVGRLRNVVVNDDLSGWSFIWRLLVALAFTGIGLVLGSLLFRHRLTPASNSRPALLGAALAVVGSIWWLVRGTGILLATYPVGFKIVHTLLALVTVMLSMVVLRIHRSPEHPLATG